MDDKHIQEFKALAAEVIRLKDVMNRRFVDMGFVDALALDREGQRGPTLFDP